MHPSALTWSGFEPCQPGLNVMPKLLSTLPLIMELSLFVHFHPDITLTQSTRLLGFGVLWACV